MIIRFALSALIGFLSHQAHHVTRKMPGGWCNLTDHTVGMVTITPLILFWWDFFHHDGASREQIRREILSGIGVASIGYGVGNAVAWVLDNLTGRRE